MKKVVGSETRLFYFNENWQCLEERVGAATTADILYVWGLRYIDDLVMYRKGAADYYSVADPNWNVVAVVNTSGVVQERYTYSAFGKVNIFDAAFVVRANSTCNVTRTFTGQVLDNETGLMLYRNRIYHTTQGRFITRDPIGYQGDHVNLYRYAYNAVTNYLDPLGKKCIGCTPRQSCIMGCEDDCYEQFGKGWWYPGKYAQYMFCVNYCPSACDTVDQSFICTLVHPVNNTPRFQCVCLLLYVLDTIPGIGDHPVIEGLDCLCNVASAIGNYCDKGATLQSHAYAAVTAADCLSSIPVPAKCLVGGLIGTTAIGGVPGFEFGCVMGELLGDPVFDLAIFAAENLISQGSIFPKKQWCDCLETLGLR
ncbi:MAG: RHS repeat-associated core domain-containing protein [Planctomycetaceae bacterium]|nr:RHS repeat-associated core domain-containing protein [Planctomycetaceae bacterium]